MAVKIDVVEREFILGSAVEKGIPARLQAAGRTADCRLAEVGKESVRLALEGEPPVLHPRERVSVYFDFRGQGVFFESRVRRAGAEGPELDLPDSMFRSLQRHWPRVRSPRGISVELLLPDAGFELPCPESREWSEVEKPEIGPGLDAASLEHLVSSFKESAQAVADEGHVVMYKGREPADRAEEVAARIGRVLFLPTLPGPIPAEEPFPGSGIVTRDQAQDLEGYELPLERSRLGRCLASKAEAGIGSALWCPVSYYRYTVGMVMLSIGSGHSLGREALDLARDFSRMLAWFLKRHGYFASIEDARKRGAGDIVDASPSGLLVRMPADGAGIKEGSTFSLALFHGGRNVVCDVRVARSYDEGKARFYGLAFRGLPESETASLADELYGAAVELPAGEAC